MKIHFEKNFYLEKTNNSKKESGKKVLHNEPIKFCSGSIAAIDGLYGPVSNV